MASWKHRRGRERRTSRRSDPWTSRAGTIGGCGALPRARAIAAALFVAFAAHAPAAHADDTKDAREAYDRGARAFGQGSYSVAATEFSRADELGPTPAALEMALKASILAEDPVLSMTLVERAAARAPNASVATQVARAKDRFSDKVVRLKITCAAPCSAKVGQEPAQVGAARYYRAGNYVIEIVSGGAPEIFAVQLPGGADMEWKPPPKALPTAAPTATVAPSVSASAAPTAAPTVVVSVAPIASVAPTTAAPGPRTSTLSPAWFAAGLGVTAVAGGLAIGFGLDTLAKHDAFLINRTDDGANAGRDAQLRTNISIGVTAAAALTTAVLGYLAFRSSGASQGTGRAASPGVHASQWPAAPWSPVLPRVDDARWAPTTSVAR